MTMKKVFLTSCAIFSTLFLFGQQSLEGSWNLGKENTIIEISNVNDVYEAKIVASDNEKVKIGTPFLKDVTLVDGAWKGQLYNLKKGKWYDVVLQPSGDKILATVSSGFRSTTLEWTRN